MNYTPIRSRDGEAGRSLLGGAGATLRGRAVRKAARDRRLPRWLQRGADVAFGHRRPRLDVGDTGASRSDCGADGERRRRASRAECCPVPSSDHARPSEAEPAPRQADTRRSYRAAGRAEGGARSRVIRLASSRPDGRRVHRHAARAPNQVELEIDELLGTIVVRRRADADETIAQPTLERAEALPLEAVERVPGRMRLRNDVARELPSPVVVVALRAREVELALAPVERRAAGGEERPHPRGDRDVDRRAAALARHERRW